MEPAAALFYLFVALAVALIAPLRGRSFFSWLLIGLLVTPVLALILLLVLEPVRQPLATDGPLKRCPTCDGYLPVGTTACSFCGHRFKGSAGPGGRARLSRGRSQAQTLRRGRLLSRLRA